MNCLEFHRLKLADPRRLSADAQAHAQSCPGCLAFARSVDETEAQLQQALATPVPEGLADRVLLRRHSSARGAWHAWALAASVTLGIALGVGYFRSAPSDVHARLMIEHVVMEPESFTKVHNADAEAFGSLLRDFGGTLKEPLGRIRYVKLCPVEDGTGWHIVFETPDGLATLLLVPDKRVSAKSAASASGWNALVQPVPRGYYAVVTASSEATDRIDRVIRERIDWKM